MKRRVDTRDYASVINKTIISYCFAQLIIYIAAKLLPSGVSALSAENFRRPGTFFFAFLNICPGKKSIVTVLGERSVYIYILHVIPIAVMRHLNYQHGVLRILNLPFMKVVYILAGVLPCYILVSKPIIRIFRKIFEPDFDIRKIPEYLKPETEK